jgi:hypothetical protein
MKLTASNYSRALFVLLALYLAGLVWGHVRLPWAALLSLRDHQLIREASAVSVDTDRTVITAAQHRHLKWALPVSATATKPVVFVATDWNAWACARVRSGIYVSPEGAEAQDCLYVCLFGAWFPVYRFSHVMA